MSKILSLSRRFEELLSQLETVESTKFRKMEPVDGEYINDEAFLAWKIKARNLLILSCGENSEHYKQFVINDETSRYITNFEIMKRLRAIFLAAKEDYDGGYVRSFRSMVQSEVYNNEIEQARELLSHGYVSAAAIIAGVVLETTLRQICIDKNIPIGKLDKMNSDLTKAGEYNLQVQKRITALADIRNSAAHGKPNEFKESDVVDMISYIENFLSERL